LGLSGGPLIVAILLSRLGRIGPLVWYLPISANFMLRELGIVLFLSCVGIMAGDQFVQTLVHGHGFYWMGCAVFITLIPLILVGLTARYFYKMNYLSLCGLLAGSMTDTPALAFASGIVSHSDAPNIAYATVYPVVVLLRVFSAQMMILFLMR
jgi:putative transport protein